MVDLDWRTRRLTINRLTLDSANPRLSPNTNNLSEPDIVRYLWRFDATAEVAESITRNGYFPTEPLLAIEDGRSYVVVEGNRRLAALKALRDPEILEGSARKKLDKLLQANGPQAVPQKVPVAIAPSRAATDRLVAVRHIGTPVRRWRPQNQARFIVNKLDEGYDESSLATSLGFSKSDVREARETQAIARAISKLDLPQDLKEVMSSPDPAVLTTIMRVIDSVPGREALHIKRHDDDVFQVGTNQEEFDRALGRLTADVLRQKVNSRSLNSVDDIKLYVDTWGPEERPTATGTTFGINSAGDSGTQDDTPTPPPPPAKRPGRRKNPNVLPRSLQVNFGAERLQIVRDELVNLDRDKFPNAGAVLLRVFFEMMVRDYLERTGEMATVKERLKKKNALRGHGQPEMGQLVEEIHRVAKAHLEKGEAKSVERALKKERWIDDLNAYVHSPRDIPTPAELQTFWERTRPLFELMLERPAPTSSKP